LPATSFLRHNIKVIRLAAVSWARKQIKLGVRADWNAAARGAKLLQLALKNGVDEAPAE